MEITIQLAGKLVVFLAYNDDHAAAIVQRLKDRGIGATITGESTVTPWFGWRVNRAAERALLALPGVGPKAVEKLLAL